MMNASRDDLSGTPNKEQDEGSDVVNDQPIDRRDGNRSDQRGRGKVLSPSIVLFPFLNPNCIPKMSFIW